MEMNEILAIVGVPGLISFVIFWYKMHLANEKIMETQKAHTELMTRSDNFRNIIARDILDFQREDKRHHELAVEKSALIRKIDTDIQIAHEDHKYLVRTFDDFKQITIDSSKAISHLAVSIEKLNASIDRLNK